MLHVHNSKNAYNTLNPDQIIPISESEALKVIEKGGLIACADCRHILEPGRAGYHNSWLDCYCKHCIPVHLEHLQAIRKGGFLKHYHTDLDIDRWLFGKYPGDKYIHIIRKNGTRLFNPGDDILVHGFFNRSDILIYHFNGRKWRKITYKKMMEVCR